MGKQHVPIFRPSWGTLPPHFVGRQKEMDDIKQMIADGVTVPLLVGRRGVGKTCLIRKVLEELEREGWVVEPPDWPGTPDRSMTPSEAATIIVEAALSYQRKVSPPPRRSSSRRPIGFASDNGPRESEAEAEDVVLPSINLAAHLENMGTRLAARTVTDLMQTIVKPTSNQLGLLVVVDELHMQGVDAAKSPIGMLAQIITQCREQKVPVRFILAGMPLAAVQMERSLGGGIDLIRTVPVGHFSLDETREAISYPLSTEGKKFEDLLLHRIHLDTDGHPKLVQFFAQSVLDLCRGGKTYTLDQYRDVVGRIEELYFKRHYHEVLQLAPKRLDVLCGMARAAAWRAEHANESAEQICVSPLEIRQFVEIEPSYLDRLLGKLMQPGNDYVYKADRALYGFLKPLLWKYLLRWRGEQALVHAFRNQTKIEIDPSSFDNPTKARVQIKQFISEATRASQRIWFVDEYWRAECVKDYVEAVNGHTDVYIFTRLEKQGSEWKRVRQGLEQLCAARKGRTLIANFEGPSNAFPVKGRFIIAGDDTGVESSQSFADLGKRLCTVSMLTGPQINRVLEELQKFRSRLEEIKAL